MIHCGLGLPQHA